MKQTEYMFVFEQGNICEGTYLGSTRQRYRATGKIFGRRTYLRVKLASPCRVKHRLDGDDVATANPGDVILVAKLGKLRGMAHTFGNLIRRKLLIVRIVPEGPFQIPSGRTMQMMSVMIKREPLS